MIDILPVSLSDLMAQGAWVLLLKRQVVESWTLGNPKQEKSMSGVFHKNKNKQFKELKIWF